MEPAKCIDQHEDDGRHETHSVRNLNLDQVHLTLIIFFLVIACKVWNKHRENEVGKPTHINVELLLVFGETELIQLLLVL